MLFTDFSVLTLNQNSPGILYSYFTDFIVRVPTIIKMKKSLNVTDNGNKMSLICKSREVKSSSTEDSQPNRRENCAC